MNKKRGINSLNFKAFFQSKKGMSEIIATLLIILLVIATAAIIWVVVRTLISSSTEDIDLAGIRIYLSIESAQLVTENNLPVVKVSVGRDSGEGNLTGVKFIFLDNEHSYSIDRKTPITELGKQTFRFNSEELGVDVATLLEVSIAPIYKSGNVEKVGQITDTTEIVNNLDEGDVGEGAVCGNGVIETGENCDGTALNGQTCVSLGYTGGTLSCSSCQFDISLCTGTPVPVCGNDIVEYGEQCDGTNLNGQTCINLGFVGGTLDCNVYCQFDTSSCIEETPASCDGIWSDSEDEGVECDGTPLPIGCDFNCKCKKGFTSIGGNICTLNPPINEGIILSVWPTGSVKYFDSNNLPKDSITLASMYTGSYINFSNSAETNCFQITFSEYLPTVDRSYLRINPVANINPNENYAVWEAENCGL